jgi:hypothetical protein
MRDEQDCGEAETRVHQRSVLAKRGSQERWMEGEQYASACTRRNLDFVSMKLKLMGLAYDHDRGGKTYKAPVYDFQRCITRESKMYRWETCAPH